VKTRDGYVSMQTLDRGQQLVRAGDYAMIKIPKPKSEAAN